MKRHEALVQLSRDHHFGLLLCWKLKQGITKNIAVDRMARYISVFFSHNLAPHFAEEEETVFNILGEKHPLISEARTEHEIMREMVARGFRNSAEIQGFRDLLEVHIRKEERQIFPEIERQATERQLQELLALPHPVLKEPEYDDEFWK